MANIKHCTNGLREQMLPYDQHINILSYCVHYNIQGEVTECDDFQIVVFMHCVEYKKHKKLEVPAVITP
jgi:hypothetical protein